MGIKGLSKIIKEYGIERNLSFYKDKKIAIDTSIFLHKFMYSVGDDKQKFLNRFIFQIKSFKKYNITPVYIFEGECPIEKKVTLDIRKNIKDKKLFELSNIICEDERKKKEKSIITITPNDILNLKEIFDQYNIEYIDSTTEGEKYCAYLNKTDNVDVVLSNDYDTLTFGCKYLLTNFNGKYIEFCLENILEKLDVNYDNFVDICISSGCDYYPKGLSRMGPIKSLNLSKKHGLIENWPNINIPEDMSLQIIRNIFKNNPKILI